MTYSGKRFDRETLFKTAVHSYAWASFIWRGSSQSLTGHFYPENIYGLQIQSTTISGEHLYAEDVAFILQALVDDMQAKDIYREGTATVTKHKKPFALVTIRLEIPTLARNTISANNASEASSNIVSQKDDGDETLISRDVLDEDSRNFRKRGSSQSSFDSKISSNINKKAPFFVQDTERKIMFTLTKLACSAFENQKVKSYYAQSASGEVIAVVNPTKKKALLNGGEILDSLIDLVEWEYREEERTGLFPTADVHILKKNPKHSLDFIATLDLYSPE